MFTNALSRLYDAAGYLAAAFLAGIGVSIIVQIVCRWFGVTFESTELAGFCLAAATFLGLAHTFRHGGHVRISLTLDRLPARAKRWLEVFNCLIAAAGICFLAWHVAVLAYQSFQFHDVSPGLLAIPFWIPQAGMSLGVLLLALALLDELLWIISGRPPRYDTGEELHSE
jgi:TRAP-type C4-dicarboxylate transport system permease small subunit